MKRAYWIIAVNLLMWLCYIYLLYSGDADIWARIMSLPGNAGEFIKFPWTILTYMFAHKSLLHLGVNMVCVWWICFSARRMEIGKLILPGYIAGGILAGGAYLIYAAISKNTIPPLMGASAAALSLMCCIAPFASIRVKAVSALIVITAIITSVTPVSGMVHLVGAVTGLSIAVLIKMRRKNVISDKEVSVESPDTLNSEIDNILTKARISGFDSLSADERRAVNEIK